MDEQTKGKTMERQGKKKRGLLRIFCLVLAALLLAGAAWYGYTALKHRRELEAVVEVSAPLDAEGLQALEQYPNLARVDLTGSPDIPAVLAWADAHPQVDVVYACDLGGTTTDNKAAALTLEKGGYTLEALREWLPLLPALRELELRELVCAPEDIAALREANPDKTIRYTVAVGGQTVSEDAQELDLTALTPDKLEETIAAMRLLPALTTVELTDAEGNNLLALTDLQKLQAARSDVLFRYRFELFGQTVSTEDERIEYKKAEIGNDGVAELRAAIPVLTRCTYLLLDDCGIDNELLAALRADFPETKIVWRVHIAYLNFLTDVKVIHLTFELTDKNAQVMRYCNEVEYLDIGHNTISDISFVTGMPELKLFILSYNHVKDLTPLASCKKLEMLELYFCFLLKDISPLTECDSLQLLNISATGVRDISPACEMKNLKRFYCIMNLGIPDEQKTAVREALPDCWITFEQKVSKNVGWSFDEKGGVRAQWYLDMAKIFRYRVEDWFFGGMPE